MKRREPHMPDCSRSMISQSVIRNIYVDLPYCVHSLRKTNSFPSIYSSTFPVMPSRKTHPTHRAKYLINCNQSDSTKMNSPATQPPMNPPTEIRRSSSHGEDAMKTTTIPAAGHMMSPDDPDNPQSWSALKKTHASACSFAFAWVV